MMTNLTKKKTIAITIIFLIPILLNWVLQWNVGYCGSIISGNDGAPVTWLAFWGTYLGAIGAFVMAYVSYFQSKKEGIRIHLRNQYEFLSRDYEIFERYMVKQLRVHSFSRITKLYYLAKDVYKTTKVDREQRIRIFKEYYYSRVQDLDETTLGYARLLEQENTYLPYGHELMRINTMYLEIFDSFFELVDSKNPDEASLDKIYKEAYLFFKTQKLGEIGQKLQLELITKLTEISNKIKKME